MAFINLNLNDVEAQTVFDPIPEGDYRVKLVDTGVFTSKAGNTCVKAVFEVMGEKFAGRKIFENFTMTSQVGKSRFKSMLVAGGHKNPDFIEDTEEAHGMELVASIGIERDEQWGDKNRVKSFKKAYRGTPAKPSTQAPPPPPPQAQPSNQQMPWG